MKVLRWIFGIPLSFCISVCIIWLMEDYGDARVHIHNYYIATAVTWIELIYIFGSPIFLSTLFVPSPKKYGAIISGGIIAALLLALFIYELYLVFSGTQYRSYLYFTSFFIICTGPGLAAVLSYFVFQNKGWNKTVKPRNEADAEMGSKEIF